MAILGQPIEDLNLKREPEAEGILDRYKQMVEQCPETMIAKMAMAMLGIEYFKDFHKKHPSFEDFREEYKSGKMQEPLLEQSEKHLIISSKLPKSLFICGGPLALNYQTNIQFARKSY